jgi:hypothetical protein
MHEWVELVKALPWWPVVTIFLAFKFGREIRLFLTELPRAVRRVRSAHGPGFKVELDVLDADLTIAQQETAHLQLPPGKVPSRQEGAE